MASGTKGDEMTGDIAPRSSMRSAEEWILWGAELSPFALKLEALLRFAGLPFRWMPRAGRFPEPQRFELRRRALVAGRLPLTWPRMTDLDEFPLVPFLFGPRGENLYDSSAIAEWLDAHRPRPDAALLLPDGDAALRFAVRLVDEALDEVGLYLVHHNRWVVSAADNDAGARLAREMRPLLGPLAPLLGRAFPARQVRRLPYLFSVARPGDASFDRLPARLRPPARPGFPPTHELLEQAFAELLAAVEPVLRARPFLFGARFTLADASLYGQLAMNRSDPSANAWMRRDAPATHAWIERLAGGDFAGHAPAGEIVLDAALAPLLDWIARAFVPLMRQNRAAYERLRAGGETRFNETAFDRGVSLYDGELLGRPFRSVAKTFQVRVWRDLRRAWDALAASDRARLAALLPAAHGLDGDT
jgi:glutathione S-transferase